MNNNPSKSQVIGLADQCLKSYIQEMGWKTAGDAVISIQGIYDTVIYPNYEFTLIDYMDLGEHESQKILGKTIMNDKVILIDRSIAPQKNDPRYHFTLGHEIGHALVHPNHGELFRCTTNTMFDKKDFLEMQANLFAENLIMPHSLVKYRYVTYYGEKPFVYTGEGEYFLSGIKTYIYSLAHLYQKIAEPLARYSSSVSKESLAYTLQKLGAVINRTDEKLKVKDIFMAKDWLGYHLRSALGMMMQ